MHWTGLLGMPRRTYTYDAALGVTQLNQVSTIGALLLGFSILLFVINVFYSLRHGEVAGGDPWDGATLEWSIPSPPPLYNFARVPVVHSRDAFWAAKYPERFHGALPAGDHPAPHVASTTDDVPVIHMPSPSYFPFMIAVGLVTAVSGLLTTLALVPVGILIILAGVYGWAYEPA
jgi:heme/copper-type cytochrome/quinol oxidase subunit 1